MTDQTKNKNAKEAIYAGVDDGYAETKIVLSNGVFIRIPSQAKAGELNQISISGGSSTTFSYKSPEGNYVVGDIREADSTAFDDYPLSAMNRVIVAHALREAGLSKEDILYICSGVPIKKFYLKGGVNQALVKAKRKNLLMNDITSKDGYLLPKISKHSVIAEGIAAWFDIVISRNEEGRLVKNKELIDQRIAIIDIGGRTTDIAVIQRGILDESRSSTIEVGMLSVRDEVESSIHDEHEIEPTAEQMNEVMENKRIKLWGEYHDVTDITESAKIAVVNRIESEVKKRLGNASDLDKVVFVGGTVEEIKNELDGWYKQQTIGENPGFANARGMQKYAELNMSKT